MNAPIGITMRGDPAIARERAVRSLVRAAIAVARSRSVQRGTAAADIVRRTWASDEVALLVTRAGLRAACHRQRHIRPDLSGR
jgi:hypothetical protein